MRTNPHSSIKYNQQQIESRFLLTHHTGLKVLAAPSTHSDALDITGKQMEIIIDNLKNCDYDVIILDTGNNTKDYSLIALDKAHTILMVTTLDITTINDTNMLLSTLRSIQFPTSKIQLVVNRMPKTNKDINVDEIAHVLSSPIIGIIPDFPKIRHLNNNGTPAVLGKENEYTAAIRKIGNKLIPVFNKRINPTAQKSKGKGMSFLTKLLGRK
jgi:pilus assembly protein CpaE